MTAFSLLIIFQETFSFLKHKESLAVAPVTQPVQWGSVVPLISLSVSHTEVRISVSANV